MIINRNIIVNEATLKRIANLALIIALALYSKGVPTKSWLKVRLDRLENLVKREIQRYPLLSQESLNYIENKIAAFEKAAGLKNQEIDSAVLINLCLAIAEQDNLPEQTINILNSLYFYHCNTPEGIPHNADAIGTKYFEIWESIN